MDLREFLLRQVEKLEHENASFIEAVIDQSELMDLKIHLEMSHILNVHHQWNARLMGNVPESEEWDLLPLVYWDRFNRTNCLELQELLNDGPLETFENLALSVQHILQHSVYHRSRLVGMMKKCNMKIPSTNLVNVSL